MQACKTFQVLPAVFRYPYSASSYSTKFIRNHILTKCGHFGKAPLSWRGVDLKVFHSGPREDSLRLVTAAGRLDAGAQKDVGCTSLEIDWVAVKERKPSCNYKTTMLSTISKLL